MVRIYRDGKDSFYFILFSSLLIGVFLLSICMGKYPLKIRSIIRILLNRDKDILDRKVFYSLRLARSSMGLLAGVGLAITGSLYQTIFKNPLATPDLIGVSSGANLGAAICIAFLSSNTWFMVGSSFLGGLIATGLALVLTRFSKEQSPTTFVLAGIVIGSLSQGLIMLIKYFADPEQELAAIEFWAMGSLAKVTGEKLLAILPVFCLSLCIIFLFSWQINLLVLTDEEGRSLGVAVDRVRIILISAATLIVASIICVTGLITFIGLIAPHLARIIRKENNTKTLILSGLIGGNLVLLADILARSLTIGEIPISILTSLVGSPFLAYRMIRKEGRRM